MIFYALCILNRLFFSPLDGFGDWSQENCDTIYSSNGSVMCRCNHLTNFAVLLVSD